jgi:rsbT co-antagonist protein RsbR
MGPHAFVDPGVCLLVTDDALVIQHASDRCLRELGCEADELVGGELHDLIAVGDRRASLALDRALGQAGTRRVDLIVRLEVGGQLRLARLLLERRAAGWQVLVELLESPDNLVLGLLADQRRWQAVLAGSSDAVLVLDAAMHITVVNANVVELLALHSEHGVLMSEEALRGRKLVELLHEPALVELRALVHDATAMRQPLRASLRLRERELELELQPLVLPGREQGGCVITLRDVGDRRRAEQERERAEQERLARVREQLAHREQLIEAQRAAIRALSAPRIPITNELTIVPFVGEITRERMAEIGHELLDALARANARAVILDITGVPNLDAGALDGLVGLSRALRMIGVRSRLTGIRPSIAQQLASLGLSSRELDVRGSLEEAIASLGPSRR